MNIADCILYLYPNAKLFVDFEVMDRGAGPYISMWNLSAPQPSQAELEAAWLPALKSKKVAEIKSEAARRINETLPDWKERRHRDQVELGVTATLTAADYTSRQQQCQTIRNASNTIEAEIQALTDPELVSGFDIANHPAWPV